MKEYKYTVIGAGIIGLSIVNELLKRGVIGHDILLVEKENFINLHQTGRNSGVIHSGIYYEYGSEKQKNCLRGYDLMIEYLNQNQIDYKLTGKLIVATNVLEVDNLNKLIIKAKKSNIDIDILDANDLKKYDNRVSGLKAVFVKKTGITDYTKVTECLLKSIIEKKVTIEYNCKPISYDKDISFLKLSDGNVIKTDKIINSSGSNCDYVYEVLEEEKSPIKILPFRGEYYSLKPSIKFDIPIYPVPNPDFPFLGIHITPSINGNSSVGPNAILQFKKDSYYKSAFDFSFFIKTIFSVGLLKLIIKYRKIALKELYKQSRFSYYEKEVKKYWPGFNQKYIESYYFGLRAQALDSRGLVDDFILTNKNDQIFHILNAPSPAATSCFSIAESVINRILENEKYN
jgi:(S)-2-hydroxyglutarate dehydrogenase